MPSVINTNISSLNTQRNLGASQASLATSIQRLSTGLRVNSAKDDAAGLAIAERMNAQVRGLNIAARNANDGVSLAQTAEGALGKIGDMVQRVRELAVQSSNASNSQTDREALDSEVSQLKQEIDRVATTTSFNNTKLLDGLFTNKSFQVGANAGESITINSIASAKLADMGGVKLAQANSGTIDETKTTVASDFTINGTNIGPLAAAATTSERMQQIIKAVNENSQTTNVTAHLDTTTNKVVLTSTAAITIAVANDGAAAFGFAAGTSALSATPTSMTNLTVSTEQDSQIAIRQADAALEQINKSRAQLGAVQSRFENAVANIQISTENISAARSRIMDTDFAAETANMTRSQILQQAGNAMLSQANQLPQQVLSLLR